MVSLETLREVDRAPGSTRHATEHDFVIDSAVTFEGLLSCETLSRALPGRLGTYVLPRDAVVTLLGRSRTTARDVRALLAGERARGSATADLRRLNHLTVGQCDAGEGGGDVPGESDAEDDETGYDDESDEENDEGDEVEVDEDDDEIAEEEDVESESEEGEGEGADGPTTGGRVRVRRG